ncbi:helix-turn-helix domain-containing protein [Nonomuraea dietziae]|uniref:helix-turn-helix domain-containing protein n=1 Tax=Nonomuraea dietziae TaxID=65515 RepID=UPI00340DEF30
MPERKQIDMPAVVRAYQRGESVRTIAQDHGVSHTVIHRRLIKAGVERRPVGGVSGLDFPDEVLKEISDAYEQGELMADLVARYGICDETVRRIAEDAGVPRRSRGAQRRIDRDAVADLDAQGWPPDAIALLVDGSKAQVNKILRTLHEESALAEQAEE